MNTRTIALYVLDRQIASNEMMSALMKLRGAYYPYPLSLVQVAQVLATGLRAKPRPEALIRGYGQSLRGWTVMDRLGEIRIPTLIVAGRGDFQFPPEHQAELAAGIANARLQIVDRAGHNPHQERPGEVMQAIRDFIPAGASGPA